MTQETDTVTLKPCPFCGGEPTSTYHIRDGRAICCGKCGATVSRYHGNSGQTDAEAIAAWNTRTKAQPASDDWRGDLLRLIAQRAQYATYDDAEDALNWIYHTATNAASESESIYRLAFNTLYVNLKKTNPDHAYTEFSSRIVKGVPWRDAFDGLEDLNTGNLTLTKASADSDALLREAGR
tara:strand:+ start:2658 stop:3200 length:543 start_codon:yes stop_codon:yes gene_type:complete